MCPPTEQFLLPSGLLTTDLNQTFRICQWHSLYCERVRISSSLPTPLGKSRFREGGKSHTEPSAPKVCNLTHENLSYHLWLSHKVYKTSNPSCYLRRVATPQNQFQVASQNQCPLPAPTIRFRHPNSKTIDNWVPRKIVVKRASRQASRESYTRETITRLAGTSSGRLNLFCPSLTSH